MPIFLLCTGRAEDVDIPQALKNAQDKCLTALELVANTAADLSPLIPIPGVVAGLGALQRLIQAINVRG